MTHHHLRDRLTVLRDLDSARRRLASNRKTADLTDKPATAALCDKLAGSLRTRIAALETELRTAPEPPPRHTIAAAWPQDGTPYRSTAYPTHIPTDAEIAAAFDDHSLDIPPFLRRT